MKQVLIMMALLYTIPAIADVPGKATNHPCRITLERVYLLTPTEYTLYWKKNYADSTIIIGNDTTIEIPGSAGAPDGAELWAVHNKTGQSTDTMVFSNYYNPDEVIIFKGYVNNRLVYEKVTLSNKNKLVTTANKDSIANKDLVKTAVKAETQHRQRFIWLSAGVLVALAGLTGIFFWRRKQNTHSDQGTGS
jgi:hypothetical protein